MCSCGWGYSSDKVLCQGSLLAYNWFGFRLFDLTVRSNKEVPKIFRSSIGCHESFFMEEGSVSTLA